MKRCKDPFTPGMKYEVVFLNMTDINASCQPPGGGGKLVEQGLSM